MSACQVAELALTVQVARAVRGVATALGALRLDDHDGADRLAAAAAADFAIAAAHPLAAASVRLHKLSAVDPQLARAWFQP